MLAKSRLVNLGYGHARYHFPFINILKCFHLTYFVTLIIFLAKNIFESINLSSRKINSYRSFASSFSRILILWEILKFVVYNLFSLKLVCNILNTQEMYLNHKYKCELNEVLKKKISYKRSVVYIVMFITLSWKSQIIFLHIF